MKFARWIDLFRGVRSTLVAAVVMLAPALSQAAEGTAGLQFQKPGRTANAAGVQFRRPAAAAQAPAPAATEAIEPLAHAPANATRSASGNPLRGGNAARVVASLPATPAPRPAARAAVDRAAYDQLPARPISEAPQPAVSRVVRRAALPAFATPDTDINGMSPPRRSRAIAAASIEPWVEESAGPAIRQAGYCDCGEPTCGICEPACGLSEPGCGMEPACGLAEPGCCMEPACGLAEPGCGIVEPGCGLEPTCGCGEPDCGVAGCGSCVGNAGSDFWCFPVCLPRLRDLRIWAGVHGFKGPRDAPAFGGAGDGNFGFHEGLNLGGRPPFVWRLFPQLSYQLGFQSVHSQLSGLSDGSTDERTQKFVTAGLFRRVPAGIQYGVVFDLMRDDFLEEDDFHQLRYEISFKSRAGREFGFWGASHLNSKTVGGTTFQTVDQHCGFLRCNFRDGGALRFWGGGSNESEGVFGGDFVAPLNTRWSLQTGFNYLIPDLEGGADAAREESWNLGMNLVWHFRCTAKKGDQNPHAPLFPMADNGWMFIDQTP